MNQVLLGFAMFAILTLSQNKNIFAKEPKTVEDFVDLLIEQQATFFPRYTCEYEVGQGEILNGREVLTQETIIPKVKIKASKKFDGYAYHKVNPSQRLNWGFPDNYVRSNQGSMDFDAMLGIRGYACVSGVKGIEKRDQK